MEMRDFLRFPGFKRKALTFSFDDGTIQDLKIIELFKKLNLKGTFNLNSGLLNVGDIHKVDFKDIDKIYEGFEIACHGEKHKSLEEVPIAYGTYDLIKDRENLENKLNSIIRGYAYANGSIGIKSRKILESCDMLYGRTAVSSHSFVLPNDFLLFNPTCHYADESIEKLAYEFVENKEREHECLNYPLLFYIWGHSYEFDINNDYERFKKIAEYLSNQDEIYYATNSEIFNYIKAYDRLEYSYNQKIIHNPSSINIYIKIFNKEIMIKPNETVNLN